MPNRDPSFCRAFVAKAKTSLAALPCIVHIWSIEADEDHCILDFSNEDPTGFPVTVDVSAEEITIFAAGFHEHSQIASAIGPSIDHALGLVRHLLSPSTRIREKLAGSTPVKWICESRFGGEWQTEGETELFLFSLFAKRSERLRQNNLLPAR